MSACQGENTAVIKGGGFPRCGAMAFFAGSPLSTGMHIPGLMTTYTSCRGTLEVTIGVTLGALDTNMRADQLEWKLVVIKIRNFPCGCIMAGCAVCAKRASMGITLKVAAHTGHRSITKLGCCQMALCTQHGHMLAIQLENIEVIERGWLPGSGGMTGCAGCTFGAGMYIILLVAADASHRCALEFAIDMALGALHFDMRAIQLER